MNVAALLQTYGPVVGVAAGDLSSAGFIFQLYRASHKTHLTMPNDRIRVLESEKADLIAGGTGAVPMLVAVLQRDLECAQGGAGVLTANLAASATSAAGSRRRAGRERGCRPPPLSGQGLPGCSTG